MQRVSLQDGFASNNIANAAVTSINHQPWDDNALRFLGELTRQKSIKSYCGKRVPFTQANADLPITCPVCVQLKADRDAAHERVMSAASEFLRTQGVQI